MIKKWLAERKRRKANKTYREGFKWAMVELTLNEKSPDFVESYIHGTSDPFNRGAADALFIFANGFNVDLSGVK